MFQKFIPVCFIDWHCHDGGTDVHAVYNTLQQVFAMIFKTQLQHPQQVNIAWFISGSSTKSNGVELF